MAKKHLGFNKVSNNIAQEYEKKGMSPAKAKEVGDATAAKVARNASPESKKANTALKKVKGQCGDKMKASTKEMKCASKVKCATKEMKCASTKKVACASKVKCACKKK